MKINSWPKYYKIKTQLKVHHFQRVKIFVPSFLHDKQRVSCRILQRFVNEVRIKNSSYSRFTVLSLAVSRVLSNITKNE